MGREIIKVIILEGGKTCREVGNKHYPRFRIHDHDTFHAHTDQLREYMLEAQQLRTFKIEQTKVASHSNVFLLGWFYFKYLELKYSVGQIYEAEIINKSTVRILR